MNYQQAFRQPQHAQALLQRIHALARPERHYRIMEFCGGHTHAIHRYGLPPLLPSNVELIHGPGCPVCILTTPCIDQAIELALRPKVRLCCYGDLLRVPGGGPMSLLKAKAQGAQVHMITSAETCLSIARDHPGDEIIFFAIGFETTTPATALLIRQAQRLGLTNLSVFCQHVLTPVAMTHLLNDPSVQLDGIIGPAHVSIITGAQAYEQLCRQFSMPLVVTGFEPVDVLHALTMLLSQINESRAEVENQYTRAVLPEGQQQAQRAIQEVFELRPSFPWRGLGNIPFSALRIQAAYAAFDAEQKFSMIQVRDNSHKQCRCAEVLKGIIQPQACRLFAKACTPERPLGSCMVSSEGACAAVYTYGRVSHA